MSAPTIGGFTKQSRHEHCGATAVPESDGEKRRKNRNRTTKTNTTDDQRWSPAVLSLGRRLARADDVVGGGGVGGRGSEERHVRRRRSSADDWPPRRRLAPNSPGLARTRPDSPGRHLGPGPALRRRRRRRRLSFACSTTRWRWRRVRRCLLPQKKEKNGSTCSSRVIGHRWNVATGSLPFRFVLFFLYVFFCRREIRAASIWLATTMSSKRFHFNQTFSIESFLRHRLGFPALPKNFIFFCFHKNLASLVCFFLFLVLELNNTASVSNGNLRDAALT